MYCCYDWSFPGPVYIPTYSSELSSLPSHPIPSHPDNKAQHQRARASSAVAPPTTASDGHCALVTMENKSPSSSCVSPAATSTMSAGESSWAMHIANFLASSPQDGIREMDDQQAAVSGGSSFSSGFSSSFDSFGDDASFITSELMCDDDDEEDESLQDTACSSAAGHQKMATMENFDLKSMAAMDAQEFNMSQLMAKYLEAMGSKQQVTGVDQQAINSFSTNEKALYESNELRKKGLCLVPISMLINYLG